MTKCWLTKCNGPNQTFANFHLTEINDHFCTVIITVRRDGLNINFLPDIRFKYLTPYIRPNLYQISVTSY